MPKKPKLSAKVFWQLLRDAGHSWIDNKSVRLGAALAFYSVLSLAPLLLLVLTAATSLWGPKAAEGQILAQMKAILGWQGAEAVQNILATAEQSKDVGPLATCIGLVTLLFSASGVFGELQDAMNIIWKAPPRRGQTLLVLLHERFFSFTMVVGSGFLLLVSLVISAWLSSLSQYIGGLLPDFIYVMQLVDFIVSFGVATFLFAVTFKTVPDVSVPWRSVWIGGALTSCLFIIGKMLIGLYLGHLGAASTYGAAGSFVAFLLWVYYSAQILFFGAEFTYTYATHFDLHKGGRTLH